MQRIQNLHVLFVGDSVTDCGRREDPAELGDGYVSVLAAQLEAQGTSVTNRGIGGDRVVDLEARWEQDVLSVDADVLSIMVGINDTWRRFDSGDATSAESFESRYRNLLELARPHFERIVLIQPFLLPVTADQNEWLFDLTEKQQAVNRLAAEFGAVVVAAHEQLSALAEVHGADSLAGDGVHPTQLGHKHLAAIWLEAVDE